MADTCGDDKFIGNGTFGNYRTATLECNFHDYICDINLLKTTVSTGISPWGLWCQEIQTDRMKLFIVIELTDHIVLCGLNNTESVMNMTGQQYVLDQMENMALLRFPDYISG